MLASARAGVADEGEGRQSDVVPRLRKERIAEEEHDRQDEDDKLGQDQPPVRVLQIEVDQVHSACSLRPQELAPRREGSTVSLTFPERVGTAR